MGKGVHFTHTTLLTRITQPVGISHVGRPPSFHDKAFPKPTQVYHMPTRGVPDQQQFYPSCYSDFKFEGDRRYWHRVHEYRGATGWLQGDMELANCSASYRQLYGIAKFIDRKMNDYEQLLIDQYVKQGYAEEETEATDDDDDDE
uniref:Transposon protein, putative, unclassified, expressed n=1 Tax=Oryza sativa subsp. japonica TaxID=39947 RepID=Q2QLM3_ORYSJ|nr:transposon protein, putative, unclassified, expressed [Oryza sativa Japonica Group]